MATPSAAQHRDLEERFRKIEALARMALAAVSKRPKFEVSAGDLTISGGDLIVDGGDFLLLDTDGSTVFRLGPQVWGDRGVSVFRETGQQALGVRKVFPESDTQTLILSDDEGYDIVAEEALGSGLNKPYMDLPLQPVAESSAALQVGPWGFESVVDSSEWTTTHQAWLWRANQYVLPFVRVKPSDDTTAAEVRMIDVATGGLMGELLAPGWVGALDSGSTSYAEVSPPGRLVMPGVPWARVSVAVQVRRTSGVGTLTVAVPEAHGA